MKEKIIKNYIDNLTMNNIKDFSEKNNINLTNSEYEYLYQIIKKDWYDLIFGNPDHIFREIKLIVDKDKYNQLYQLYQKYKDKYSHYL